MNRFLTRRWVAFALCVGAGARQDFCLLLPVAVEHGRALPPDSTLLSMGVARHVNVSLHSRIFSEAKQT